MDGFVCIDKPKGISSFKVVSLIRKHYRIKRVGHCGTLDPMATGVLVVALGSATKLIPYLSIEPKLYTCTVQFGIETDTLDAEGSVTINNGRIPGADELTHACTRFTGTYNQRPPDFSAVKVDGVRAYRHARKKEEMQLQTRPVTIDALSILEFDPRQGRAVIVCRCGSGTYIRALARDIAYQVDSCAFTTSMRRIYTGLFDLREAFTLVDIKKKSLTPYPYSRVFENVARIDLSSIQIKKIRQGMDIALDTRQRDEYTSPIFGFDNRGALIAVLKKHHTGLLHPVRVFSPGSA